MSMQLEKWTRTTPRWRILVVENDPQTRGDHIRNLKRWGYQVFAAQGLGQALLGDARKQARSNFCHVALVDMRLLSDDDSSDTSGLDLARDLKPAETIVVTGYADKPHYSRMAVKQGVLGMVGKEEGPDILRQVIDDTLQKCWDLHRDMEFSWCQDAILEQIATYVFSEALPLLKEEVMVMLMRLFPDAKSLRVDPFYLEQSTASLTLRPQSLMLRVRQDDYVRSYFVRIGREFRVEQEASNFRRINSCVGYSLTPRSNPVVLWNLGGICYELVGNVLPFSHYYATHELSDVRRILSELAQSWQRLYHSDCERLNQLDDTVFGAYGRVYEWVLGTDWHRSLLETGRHYTADFPEPYRCLKLPDSISWVVRRLKLTSSGEHAADCTPKIGLAMTHGDLHSDNILINDRGEVHFIGLDRTGYGPALRDYVELEADILTRLTPLTVERAELWDLYLAVVTPLDSGKTPKMDATERLLRHPETRKAFFTIKELRQQALRSVGYFDQDTYLWSMLLEIVLSQLTMIRGHLNQDVMFSRLGLLGSIICSRLDSWDRRWPPTEWHRAAAALPEIKWVSEADQKAQANYVAYLQGRMKDVIADIEQARKEQRNPRDLLEKKLQIEEQLRAFGEEL